MVDDGVELFLVVGDDDEHLARAAAGLEKIWKFQKRNAARENRTLNNYVESVLLGIVYDDPNEVTKAAIRTILLNLMRSEKCLHLPHQEFAPLLMITISPSGRTKDTL